jgi:REP element-mobilizing transposase RayT
MGERNRKLNRLEGYNYSQNNYYFITICSKNREHWFGEIENNDIKINRYGEILNVCWLDLPNHYKNCFLDVSVIMPNHFHGIVIINNDHPVGTGLKPVPEMVGTVGTGLKPVPTETKKQHGLSEMVRALKTFSSRRINEISGNDGVFRWQRSFYDHIIRDGKSLENIRNYIIYNPQKWQEDIFLKNKNRE